MGDSDDLPVITQSRRLPLGTTLLTLQQAKPVLMHKQCLGGSQHVLMVSNAYNRPKLLSLRHVLTCMALLVTHSSE